MKAVILMAGKGTRCYPLTLTKPKSLLKVTNKTILQIQLEQLQGIVNEAILVVGYEKEVIMDYCKDKWNNTFKSIKISFAEQKEQKGTGDALLQTKSCFTDDEKVICLNGDDLLLHEDIKQISKFDYALLLQEHEDPERYGVAKIHDEYVEYIVEKPNTPPSHFVSCGCYVFDTKIFNYLKKIKPSPRGEYEIVDGINGLMKEELFNYVITEKWMPMSYVWQLLDVNKKLMENIKTRIDGKVEKWVTIKGNVNIGKGTIVKSGVYIDGPAIIGENCNIGPNCYIRQYTSIGDNCKVGNACEIKNTILFDNVSVGHLSYIGDSILGSKINLGAGTITANLRHDNGPVKTLVGGKLVDVGRKFGTVIGDNVHTGIHTSIYPGRKLFPNTTTLPGEIVKEDINVKEVSSANSVKNSVNDGGK